MINISIHLYTYIHGNISKTNSPNETIIPKILTCYNREYEHIMLEAGAIKCEHRLRHKLRNNFSLNYAVLIFIFMPRRETVGNHDLVVKELLS